MALRAVSLKVPILLALANTVTCGAECSGVIHRLWFSGLQPDLVLSLPAGAAVVAMPQADDYALASAYRAALAEPAAGRSVEGKRSIVVAGPTLDAPDDVRMREIRCEGNRITVRIDHTSAFLRNAQLRRNEQSRLLLEVPVTFAPGRYTIEVHWQPVDVLTDGKPVGEPMVVGPTDLTV